MLCGAGPRYSHTLGRPQGVSWAGRTELLWERWRIPDALEKQLISTQCNLQQYSYSPIDYNLKLGGGVAGVRGTPVEAFLDASGLNSASRLLPIIPWLPAYTRAKLTGRVATVRRCGVFC